MTCTIPTSFPSSPDSSPSLLDNENSLAATSQATSLHLTSVDCAVSLDSSVPIFDAPLLPFRERNTYSYNDRAFSLGSKIFDKGAARLQPSRCSMKFMRLDMFIEILFESKVLCKIQESSPYSLISLSSQFASIVSAFYIY